MEACTTRIGPYSYNQYLVHGPCFPGYTCLDIRKCTKFKIITLPNPLRPAELISILWKPMVCTTRTPNIRPIAQRATWYMDHASHDTIV